MKRIRQYLARLSRGVMTCPVRPNRASAPVVQVPTATQYSRSFHAPVFRTVTVVSTVTVVILPAPLKIVHQEEEEVV